MKFDPNVLFEDNHLLIVNKPAGILVQGDKTGDLPISELYKKYLKEKYNKPGNVFMGVSHRIDRPVSGALILAKTSKALERINRAFQEKNIQKTYWAVVSQLPNPSSDTLIHYLKKNQKQNKSYASVSETPNSKKCELTYKHLFSTQKYHLLEVYPKTGRHHQIRVQLSTIGSIIKGDLKYGAPRSNKDASIHLHARKIELIHPVKKEPLTIVAPCPKGDNLWKSIEEKMAKNN